jgi:hypothetical protein
MAKAHLYQPRMSGAPVSYYVLHKMHGLDVVIARSRDDGGEAVLRLMREKDLSLDGLSRVELETEDGLFTLDDNLVTIAEYLLTSRESDRLSVEGFDEGVGKLRSFF